jgi:outer membrane protein OmpA-like peptidoglycan-associated protein
VRRRMGFDDDSQDFWPAFTDLISTVSLVLFLVMLLAIAQAGISARFTIEGSKRVQEIFNQRAATTRELVEEIGSGQATVDESAAIHFNSDVLFAYNSFELTDKARREVLPPVAKALGKVLQQYGDSIETVVVEGHTAGPNRPTDRDQWVLGAQRAIAVLTFMQEQNPVLQKPEVAAKLGATSYSYYRPPSSAQEIPLGRCIDQTGQCNQIRRIEIRVVLRDQGLRDEVLRVLGQGQ